MTMSTQTLDEAGRAMAKAILIDTLQIFNVGQPVTEGINVTRTLTAVGTPIRGLVQTTTLANAVEGRVNNTYSIKVPRGTDLAGGQAIRVETCVAEPDLVGMVLLVDKISKNGLAMIRKAVAQDWDLVNPEGKRVMA